jgi:putative two-component system response regulator
MSQKKLPRMLVADDETMFIRALKRVLRHKIEVVGASTPTEAILLVNNEDFDIVLAEISMADAAGTRFADWFVETHPEGAGRLILTSAGRDVEICLAHKIRDNCAFLHKPFDADDLLLAISGLLENGSGGAGKPAFGKVRPKILVVDDDPQALDLIKIHSERLRFDVLTAPDAVAAVALILKNNVDIVVCDQIMPRITGIELLTLIRLRWPHVARIMISASDDPQLGKDVIDRQLVHFFLSKPWKMHHLQEVLQEAHRVHWQMNERNQAESARDGNLMETMRNFASRAALVIADAIDDKESEGTHHSQRVASCALAIGRTLRLDAETMGRLYIGGLLHDVGKIGIPDEVLLKPGALTEDEFTSIKTHPRIGATLVEPLSFHQMVNSVVLHHHENFDGSGYPEGLSRDDIPLPARIVRVADSYVAMSTKRVYRDALSPGHVRDEVVQHKGTHFDPFVVEAFLDGLEAGRMNVNLQAPSRA